MHKTKDEVISIAGGLICMETGDSPDNLVGIWMGDNTKIRLKPGTWHRFTGMLNTVMWEGSTHHDEEDTVRDLKGGTVSDEEFKALTAKFFTFENQDRRLSLANAGLITDTYRKEGKTVGLYLIGNESLDQQVAFLRQSRLYSECLFVGVPKSLMPLLDIIEAIRYIDYVVEVEGAGVDVIKRLKPDVYTTVNSSSLESQEATKQGATVIPVSKTSK